MRAWLLGGVFAMIAVAFWDDESFRHQNILLANIWWAVAYLRWRRP